MLTANSIGIVPILLTNPTIAAITNRIITRVKEIEAIFVVTRDLQLLCILNQTGER